MKTYKGYLIDLDGTLYYGKDRIPTAEQFIKELLAKDLPFLLITNNATRSPEEFAAYIRDLTDLPIQAAHLYTSTMTLIAYLNHHHPGEQVLVVGEEPLKAQIRAAGFELTDSPQADVVCQGLNRQTTYEELKVAVQAILNGADFLVTNQDRVIPTENGFIPSSGALTAFLAYASRTEPVDMGKPQPEIIRSAIESLGLPAEDVLLIGDNYETDIQAGIRAGIDTCMVYTGVTHKEDYDSLPIKPTYVLNDLSEYDLSELN